MRVLFVTPECAPLVKTGGLGDVSAALPKALRAQGCDVRTLLPGYAEVLRAASDAPVVAELPLLGFSCRLLAHESMLVLDCPALFARDGGPYQTHDGHDWKDNGLRFGVLSRAAAVLAGAATPLAWRPEILHCNDWPAALAPAYLEGEADRARTLVTIHNLAFQGNFESALREPLDLPASLYHLDGIEFYGQVSFLKGGIAFADAITTVSPSYAREIQGETHGCGLDGLLRRRRETVCGILNGIDTEEWDPGRDRHIAARYTRETLDAKALNKAALQRRLGLRVQEELPLIGIVGRLTHQKGADLVAAAADALAAMPAQVALLGRGDRTIEAALQAAANRHPGAIAVVLDFDEALAHAIEAGADLFLMPSRFEPCGLNQMYSQRYGTPPVARATGGLVDSIVDGATGFLFEEAETDALLAGVRRALAAYRDAARWRRIQLAGMAVDFSWDAAGLRYADLYRRLATRPLP